MNINRYTLILSKNKTQFNIDVCALDTNHAQAQAYDILRAFDADKFDLIYEVVEKTALSRLLQDLAHNSFEHDECYLWADKYTNGSPCIYAFRKRFYVKDIILKYLNIPKDTLTAKLKCKNKNCINPYHFEYHKNQNSKLTCGDTKLLLAYRSQGAGVDQIAKALNVHRSTVYRKLKDERFSAGIAGNR